MYAADRRRTARLEGLRKLRSAFARIAQLGGVEERLGARICAARALLQ
jgi:hypothetical protein